uniref:Uncharacterized protein n=2 Tax=Moniliophthora roreri TaxID=221103 RepID=A0A0W0EUA1_MONRR
MLLLSLTMQGLK